MTEEDRKKERIKELEALIAKRRKLSAKEYLSLLHEIRKNYVLALAIESVEKGIKCSGAYMNLIDKTHWLIENLETSTTATTSDSNYTIKYEYDAPAQPEA